MPKTGPAAAKPADAQPAILSDAEPKPAQAAANLPASARLRPPNRSKAGKASAAKSKKRAAPSQSKQGLVIQMLRRRSGVSIEEIIAETGWQPHSVRGFFSGLVKKKLKLHLTSEVGRQKPDPSPFVLIGR